MQTFSRTVGGLLRAPGHLHVPVAAGKLIEHLGQPPLPGRLELCPRDPAEVIISLVGRPPAICSYELVLKEGIHHEWRHPLARSFQSRFPLCVHVPCRGETKCSNSAYAGMSRPTRAASPFPPSSRNGRQGKDRDAVASFVITFDRQIPRS